MTAQAILGFTTAVVFLKHFVLVLIQGGSRVKSKSFRYPEDGVLNNGTVGDSPTTERAQRIINNNLESEPIFLLLLAAYLFLGPEEPDSLVGGALTYAGVFLGARLMHMTMFFARKSLPRTLSYGVGLLATLGVAVQVILNAI